MNGKVFDCFSKYIQFRFVDYVLASIGIIILSLLKMIESVAKILWFIPCILVELVIRIFYFFKTDKNDKRLK